MITTLPANTLILDVESGRWYRITRSITVYLRPIADDPDVASFYMNNREYTVSIKKGCDHA